MMLWIVLALMLAATLAALLYPLWSAPKPSPARAAYDLAVYRAQLAEVNTDVERGLIAPDQAEAARLEIQRRMLAAASASPVPGDDRRARRAAAIVIVLILPLGAGLLYAAWGNPQLPDRPYAQRLEHDPAVILANAAVKLNATLSIHPSPEGYFRLAELEARIRDYDRAADAYRHAIKLGSDNAYVWGALGEVQVLAAGGAMTPDALASFAQALERDSREPRARFYAGMAEAQIGDLREAVAIWRDLEQDSKSDAPWLPLLRQEIAVTAKAGRFDPAAIAPTPASAAALKAAVAAMHKAMGSP